MRGQYSAGVISYRAYRGHGPGKEEIECVHHVDLPALPVPTSVTPDKKYPNMILRLHFLSALDAADAMKDSGFQTISIRTAEEYWDIYNAEIGVRAVEHVLRVNPRVLIPGPISGEYSAKMYFVPPGETDYPNGLTEVEPLSFQQAAHSLPAACEYDVVYYAAYCDGKELWKVCPAKQIYRIGGTQYLFPAKSSE